MLDPTIIGIVGMAIIIQIIAIYLTAKIKVFSRIRAMTAPMFALTMIPAFYTILGTTYQIDLVANWGMYNYWYYMVSWYPAYAIGIALGGIIRATGHLTLPDRFAKYGTNSEFLSSIISFLYLMPLDVMVFLGVLGALLLGITNVATTIAIMFVLGIFLIAFTSHPKLGWSGYSLAGVLYFIFMTVGIGIGCVALLEAAGGWENILTTVDPGLLTPWFTDIGGFISGLADPATLIWFLMGFIFIVDPMVWQRFSLTESDKAARRGMVYAFIFWMIFDLCTAISGLAIISIGIGGYLETAATLPVLWAGLILAANLMMAFAGGSAYLHAGGMIFSQNLAKRLGLVSPDTLSISEVAEKWYTRGVWILGLIALTVSTFLTLNLPSDPTTMAWLIVSGLLFGSLMWPSLFGGLFFREKMEKSEHWYHRFEVPRESVNLSMLFGFIVTLGLLIYGLAFPTATHPIFTLGITPETASGTPFVDASRIIGFLASIVGWILGFLLHKLKG